jgi:gliding motility-associated-like protein
MHQIIAYFSGKPNKCMLRLLLRFLLFILFLLPKHMEATNLVGGEISYEHLGNNVYRITVVQYNNSLGIAGPSQLNLCITSSCSFAVNLTLLPVPHPKYTKLNAFGDTVALPFADDLPDEYTCAFGESSLIGATQVYTFQGEVQLNLCSDWKFSAQLRPRTSIYNSNMVVNASMDGSLYLEAFLNNLMAPNSSPQFNNPGVQRLCQTGLGAPNSLPFKWDHGVVEADGDSLYYRLIPPKWGICNANNNYEWSAGFSTLAPIKTSDGLFIDQSCGTFNFRPIEPGGFVVAFVIEEYRFDNQRLRWIKVGTIYRDVGILIENSCRSTVMYGPQIDLSMAGYQERLLTSDSVQRYLKYYLGGPDTTQYAISNPYGLDTFKIPVIPYQCNNKTFTLRFNTDVYCPSIHPTDFRLIGPDGKARPITHISTACNSSCGSTPYLTLNLEEALDQNGEYLLYIKTGNDGTTLENSCGYQLRPNYYMILKVEDCPELQYSIQNVTVLKDELIHLEFALDSTSYFPENFDRLSVWRANNNANFYLVGTIEDQQQRSFIDSSLYGWAVDNQIYQYALQLHTNGTPHKRSNVVNSIVLKVDSVSGNLIQFSWNPYVNDTYGGSVHYEFFSGIYDPLRMHWTWSSVQNLGDVTQFDYVKRVNRAGMVCYKVEATDASGVNTTLSESNYVYLEEPTKEVEMPITPVVNYIPNVITPNGDAHNDRFFFDFITTENKRPYSDVSLSIFTRWGMPVFKDDQFMQRNTAEAGWDGTDYLSGKPVADGVYFYVAVFADQETGKTETLHGSITVSRGSF